VTHETPLIAILAAGLVFAFVGGLIAQRLRLPPLVGYLLAGVAVGPYTPGFVGDEKLAGELAEIGVILLMFGVGLHFSIRDLMAARAIAVPGAVAQMAAATAMGAGVAWLWGWGLGAGLVFGLALSVASTVVLLRALEERGLLDSEKGRIAVGWLIVEDLAMVLALVVIPALAGSFGQGGGGASLLSSGLWLGLALTMVKAAAFLALMLVAGKRAIPWLLEQAARTGSRELFTLAVLALALGIAYGSAQLFGVSFALGAFFAGVILAESDLSHQAAADSLPLQDAFAVLFFVSVGMLFDPSILVREPWAVLAVVGIIVVGKSLAAMAIVLLFGHPVGTALTISASLAQIGEFSFILAGLGVATNLLPAEGRDLILAGALISITLNPLFFPLVDRIDRALRDRPRLRAVLERPGKATQVPLLPPGAHGTILEGHAVIIGAGRVGGAIGRALDIWELPYSVVEHDRRLVETLRSRGVAAVFGDAAAPGILSAAGIERARLIVIATPDGIQSQRILELARRANPGIDTVVRTHSEEELRKFEEQNVGLAVLAERELALGMMGYTLRILGLSEGEARLFVQSSRKFDDAGMAPEHAPAEGAPELRPHRD
jgi:CPA2 family monovalent cation:H+ antiporter-2